MIQLSPRLVQNVKQHRPEEGVPLSDALRNRKAMTICVYRCGECDEEYDDQLEADDCCLKVADDGEVIDSACPACTAAHNDAYAAADCCLWKDIGPAERFRIALAVRGGAEWADAIAEVTGDRRVLS